jgi:hypothetical protein
MEAFNLPFRPGAGSSKEKDQKKTSDFFAKNDKGKSKAGTKVNGTQGEMGTGTGTGTGSKRKRSAEGETDGEGDDEQVIDVDGVEDAEDDDEVEVLPTPPKRTRRPAEASPEWEMSDAEGDVPDPTKSAPARPATHSPEWELSDNEEPAAKKDKDKTVGLELNGTLMWKDPLGSDSDEADEEPAAKKAKV